VKQSSPIRQFLRTSGLGRWGLAVTVLLILLAVLAPWIAPANPSEQSLPNRLLSPNAHHWMGADELGRDVLSRTQ
jgi:peptide/nickel transport system permease protein